MLCFGQEDECYIRTSEIIQMDEQKILERFLSGDREAPSLLYKMYAQDLFSYGSGLTRDRELLKDAVQDVFFKVLANRKLLKDVRNLRYFFFRSLKNRLIDLQKSAASKNEPIGNEEQFPVKVTVLDNLIEKEEQLALETRLKSLLDKLTAHQREAVCLRFIYEMEYDEIAGLLNLQNSKSARNLVSRAMERMRSEGTDLFLLFLLIYMFSQN